MSLNKDSKYMSLNKNLKIQGFRAISFDLFIQNIKLR